MRLISARIQGFQSFSDTGEVKFAEGINLVIGQNNSGKSALLRALLRPFPDDRHRTPEKWEPFRSRQPEVALTLEVGGAEIRDWVLRSGSQQILPSRVNQDPVAFARDFFELPSITISVTKRPGSEFLRRIHRTGSLTLYLERSMSPLLSCRPTAN
jgi:recombinational DNA repair ATPase RecF